MKVYVTKISRILKLINKEPRDTSFFKDYIQTIKFLENQYENINSRSLYLSSLLIWFQANKFNKKLIKRYRSYLLSICNENKKIQEDKMLVKMDFTRRDIETLRDEYECEIQKINYQPPYNIKTKDKKLLQNYLLFLFYSGIYTPPPRNNLWNILVLEDVDVKKVSKNFNYICKKSKCLVYTNFKTRKSKGVVRVKIPEEFYEIIISVVDMVCIDNFLFKNIDTGKVFHSNSFTTKVKRAFKGKATINTLRHLYLTTRHTEIKEHLRALKKDTEGMMSSSGTALKFYIHEILDEIEKEDSSFTD
jgi:hypothetical protein